jgi:hypothetical protein
VGEGGGGKERRCGDQDQGKREAIKASSEADVEKRREMERKLLGEGKKQQEAPVEEDA